MDTTHRSDLPTLGVATPRRLKLASLAQRYAALLTLLLVCVIAAIRYEPFFTPENLFNILRQNSMLGIAAIGMTFVILSGGIDLSVGSLIAVGGVVAAYSAEYGSITAVLLAVAATTLLGCINGLLISKGRLQPFIATLGMMIAARGVALLVTGEASVRVSSAAEGLKWLGRGWVGMVPVPVILLFVAYMLAWAVLSYTRFGRHVYALGDNEDAARLMGLRVDRVTLAVYALAGALAGLAGVLLASRLGAGQPIAAEGWELDAIAAVVVGGTLLTGGQGGVLSTLVGLLLLGVILNIFNLEGSISSWWQWVLRGTFLLAVVVLQKQLTGQTKGSRRS